MSKKNWHMLFTFVGGVLVGALTGVGNAVKRRV